MKQNGSLRDGSFATRRGFFIIITIYLKKVCSAVGAEKTVKCPQENKISCLVLEMKNKKNELPPPPSGFLMVRPYDVYQTLCTSQSGYILYILVEREGTIPIYSLLWSSENILTPVQSVRIFRPMYH